MRIGTNPLLEQAPQTTLIDAMPPNPATPLQRSVIPGRNRSTVAPAFRSTAAPFRTAPITPVREITERGRDLLMQVRQGLLPGDRALASFETILQDERITRNARGALLTTFAQTLPKLTQVRRDERPTAPPLTPATPGDDPGRSFADRALDVSSQGVSGLNVGLAQGLGAPVDLVAMGLNLLSLGLKEATGVDFGQADRPFLGSRHLQDLLEDAGTIAPPSDDPAGQFVRRTGESVGAAVAPGAVVLKGALKLVEILGPAAIPLLRQIARAPGRTFAAELGAGLSGGVGAATANQIAPDSETADLVGETIGSLSGAVSAAAAARALARRAAVQAITRNPDRLIAERNRWTRGVAFEQLFDGSQPSNSKGLRKSMLNDKTLRLEDTKDWVAHHVVPWSLRSNRLIRRLGMNLNDPQNGIDLPPGPEGGKRPSPHFGFHEGYSEEYEIFIKRLEWAPISDAEKKVLLAESIVQVKRVLHKGKLSLSPNSVRVTEDWHYLFNRIAKQMGLPTQRLDD